MQLLKLLLDGLYQIVPAMAGMAATAAELVGAGCVSSNMHARHAYAIARTGHGVLLQTGHSCQ